MINKYESILVGYFMRTSARYGVVSRLLIRDGHHKVGEILPEVSLRLDSSKHGETPDERFLWRLSERILVMEEHMIQEFNEK